MYNSIFLKGVFAVRSLLSILSCVLLVSPSFSKASMSSEVSKESMAYYMASVCSAETWKPFSKIAKKEGLFAKNFQFPKQLKISSHEATDVETGIRVSWSSNSATLNYKNKTYSGSDPCEVLVKLFDQPDKSANLFDYFIPKAHAADIVREAGWYKVYNAAMAAFGALGWTACMVGTAPTVVGPAVCAVLPSIFIVFGIDELLHTRKVEEFWNNPFKISCNSKSVILENSEKRVVIDKSMKPVRIDIIKTKNKSSDPTNNSGDSMPRESTRFAEELANKCNNSTDASNIDVEIAAKRKEVRSIVEEIKSWALGSNPYSKKPTNSEVNGAR